MADNLEEDIGGNAEFSSHVLETPEASEIPVLPKSHFPWQKWALIIFGVPLAVGISTYLVFYKIKPKPETGLPVEIPPEAHFPGTVVAPVFASKFASYEEVSVDIKPQVQTYSVDKNLVNITNKDDFTFSEAAKNLLAKNDFVVVPADHQEFFSIYESNRYRQLPGFVTTDSMLHNYHLMFGHILKKLEEEKLIPELKSLNTAMLSLALEQYQSLKGSEWENAAKRNVGFFAVGSRLLDTNVNIPEIVKSEVGQELSLVETHQGIDTSPVMNIGASEDVIIKTPQGPLPVFSNAR